MTDLFNQEDQPVTFDDLVGEGKKFKTPDDLAKAKAESDRFIEQLKHEAELARQELRSRTNLEDVVNQLKAERNPPPSREIANTPREEPIVENRPAPEDIETKVVELLKSQRQQEVREQNINLAKDGLRERFGADYNQTLRSIIEELGISEQFILDLAAQNPKGFFKIVDSVKTPDDNRPTTPPNSRVNTVLPNNSGRRNKAYYDELRRKDINSFLSPKVQNQYYKDAMEQGDKFYT